MVIYLIKDTEFGVFYLLERCLLSLIIGSHLAMVTLNFMLDVKYTMSKRR